MNSFEATLSNVMENLVGVISFQLLDVVLLTWPIESNEKERKIY